MTNTAKRLIAKWLLVCFTLISCTLPTAQAAMIGTEQVLGLQQAQQERAKLASLLQRQDLQEQLLALGVDPQDVQNRIGSLSDQEVAALNQHMDELPAGSGIIGTLAFIFVLLLVTDILGYTNVFPFVKKTVN